MTTRRRTRAGKERLRLGELRGWKCSLCSGQIEPRREAYEIEHTIPLAMGGDDEDDNITVVHAKCHKAKTLQDFGLIAKAKRREMKHLGAKPKSARGFRGWRKFNGVIVTRERRT